MIFESPTSHTSPIGTHCFTTMSLACDKGKDRVVINVGGTRHECYISTIQSFPDTRLYWIAETALKMVDFDPEGNEFFFDRHPGCFQNILNYCRTGKLHCPNDVCGPLFEQELAFWGVDELMMEPCCWGNYTQHRDAHKNLLMFDEIHNDENEEVDDDDDIENNNLKTKTVSSFEKTFLKIRPKIWSVLEKPYSSAYAQINAFIVMVIIIASITTFCMETMAYFGGHTPVFRNVEYFYCAFFTTEFIIRMICCPSLKEFFKSVMTWIDFVSNLQFYISFFAESNAFDFLSVSRLIRVFRLFRFFKNLSGMQVIGQTLKASATELFLLVLIVLIPMVIFSTLMFYAEQHSTENEFKSIPEAFWWAIITMTTVGYGDIAPRTGPGKIIGSMCACSGILIVALPVSVIGSNFTLYYSYAKARMRLPKRRSPALVSADKALVNNQDQNDEEKPNGKEESNGKDMVPIGLQDLASVMVDLTVPRSRRHAIQPIINPISRVHKTRRFLKGGNKHSISAGLVSTMNVQLRTPSLLGGDDTMSIDENDEKYEEKEDELSNKDEHCCLLQVEKTSFDARNKSLPSLTVDNLQDYSTNQPVSVSDVGAHNLIRTRHFSKSDNGNLAYDVKRSPRNIKPKRVLHMDITQYVPRKISVAEHKARSKLNQYTKPHSQTNSDQASLDKGLIKMSQEHNDKLILTGKQNNKKIDQIKWMREARMNESPVSAIVTQSPKDQLLT